MQQGKYRNNQKPALDKTDATNALDRIQVVAY